MEEGRGEQHPVLSTPTRSQTPLSVTADCHECAQRPEEHVYLSSSVRSETILELESGVDSNSTTIKVVELESGLVWEKTDLESVDVKAVEIAHWNNLLLYRLKC